MIDFTILGEVPVILFAALAVCIGCLAYRRYWLAMHVLALELLTLCSSQFFKSLLHVPRPSGIANVSQSFSMPSGHTLLATTAYVGLALLIASAISQTKRIWIYSIGCLLAFVVGFSRIYLSAHWFTDVFSSWILGGMILMIIAVSFNTRRTPRMPTTSLAMIGIFSLIVGFTYYHYQHFQAFEAGYTKILPPQTSIHEQNWWQQERTIPVGRTSLFGFPSQTINIEWAGTLPVIQKTLSQLGWVTPPTRDWISIIHRLANIKSANYLPMISPQYLDQKPALTLTRYLEDASHKQQLFVLRLWESNCALSPKQTPLWVGTVGRVPSTYSWLSLNRGLSSFNLNTILFDASGSTPKLWQWKILPTESAATKRRKIRRPIILIRPAPRGHHA